MTDPETGDAPAARRESWKTEPMPALHARIAFDRALSDAELAVASRGFVPREMEDKWFIFGEDGTFYFHRSWTGHCIYVVRFEREGDGWRAREAVANRDPAQYRPEGDAQDARRIHGLIDAWLLRRDD